MSPFSGAVAKTAKSDGTKLSKAIANGLVDGASTLDNKIRKFEDDTFVRAESFAMISDANATKPDARRMLKRL